MNKLRKALIITSAIFCQSLLFGQNPYLPLWEYIPDGEPYVFEDPDRPGEYRVYIYGSHDTQKDSYCGRDQVVWSASVNDLRHWRYDGVIFTSEKDRDGNALREDGLGDVLFAPDIAVRQAGDRKLYYLYPNTQDGRRHTMVAVSERPDGPFKVVNWSKDDPAATSGVLGFDPAVFVDDDGRVYGYWGFEHSYGAELDPENMADVLEGTEIVDGMIPSCRDEGEFRFFEASSLRKIEDKYVLIYSRMTAEGENGLPACNYNLAYAYSDAPLGPWTYGGTIIDCRGRDTDAGGKVICTGCPYGNTHGSIVKIGKQWWVFYHRQTGTDEYSRQAMVSPIEVKVQKGKGGKVSISEAEITSEGFSLEGLDPLRKTPAGLACYFWNPGGVRQKYPNFFFSGPYVKPTRPGEGHEAISSHRECHCPVVNNTPGSTVGYKYMNFNILDSALSRSSGKRALLELEIVPEGNAGVISVLAGGPTPEQGGVEIARFGVRDARSSGHVRLSAECRNLRKLKGKQPLFFVFSAPEDSSSAGTANSAGASSSAAAGTKLICELHSFRFAVQ
ncbi:MAG: family 43 glycosylhydrolase [Bacteroidales bacterium]|nr:family 43 glycosylhydrolase [Bacteroidales bacterium]